MKPLLMVVLGLMLMGFCGVTASIEFMRTSTHAEPLRCEEFCDHPTERWVKLTSCTLDFDGALLGAGPGVYERLADRQLGLSRTLHDNLPEWKFLLVPVRTPANRAKPARLVYEVTDPELLRWVNAWEAASGKDREVLLRKRTFVDRLATPGILAGIVDRGPETEEVQKALGRDGAAGLMRLKKGEPPPFEWPLLAVGLGLLGFALTSIAMARINSAGRARLLSAEEEAAVPSLADVKVELGALHSLREDENGRRRRGRADQEEDDGAGE